MKYDEIVSFGFARSWRHKSLWLLGFLTAGFSTFNYSLNKDRLANLEDIVLHHPFIIVSAIGFLIVLGLILFILRIIAEGALIDAAKRFHCGEEYRLGASWQVGMSRFWSLLGAGLLFLLMLLAFLLVLILIGVVAFLLSKALGIILLIFLIPALLVGIFAWAMTYVLAQRLIVLERRPVFDSIGDGFSILTQALPSNVLMFLIYVGIMFAAIIVSALIVAAVTLPFIAIALYRLWLALLLGIPTGLVVLYLIGGYLGAASSLMMTEFYYQLMAHLRTTPIAVVASGPGDPGTPSPDSTIPPVTT